MTCLFRNDIRGQVETRSITKTHNHTHNMNKPTQYEFWLRAYINHPSKDDCDQWLQEIIPQEDNIEFDLKDMDKNNWDSSEPILFFEVEVVKLTWDEDDSVYQDYGHIDKDGKVQSAYYKVPKYIQSKVDKWEHLDFYKEQYLAESLV